MKRTEAEHQLDLKVVPNLQRAIVLAFELKHYSTATQLDANLTKVQQRIDDYGS